MLVGFPAAACYWIDTGKEGEIRDSILYQDIWNTGVLHSAPDLIEKGNCMPKKSGPAILPHSKFSQSRSQKLQKRVFTPICDYIIV